MRIGVVPTLLCSLLFSFPAFAQPATQPQVADPALAKQLGADQRGMRNYILVILKTGPHRVPDGPARDDMFKGHFANIKRLASEGKLVLAGPFGDQGDWRGMFVFALETPEEAEKLVATDPVIRSGEMVAEYHKLYASAALMAVTGIHGKIAPQ
ncbi:MAG: hypothetical protein QOJ16_3510 [Acidobacteriota bacterium]|jgi:uncharacterized protein YciI|nr:hypothetical protein [Acidobacteriota bacterium]